MLACVREGLARRLGRALRRARGRRRCAPLALGDGAVDVRRVPELGLVGEPVAARDVDADPRTRSPPAACPVVAPLGRDARRRRLLNVNADDAAAAIAAALGADELVFLSDVPGVLDERRRGARRRSPRRAPPASASGGMLPKLEACAAALLGGVARVRIGVAGTVVTR